MRVATLRQLYCATSLHICTLFLPTYYKPFNRCARHESGMMNMNDYYFYVATDEEGLGWEFTISDLIESEFEARPGDFPDKSAIIEFLKELIADIEECVGKEEEKIII